LEEIAKIFDGPNAEVAHVEIEKLAGEGMSSSYRDDVNVNIPEQRYTSDLKAV
jgi:hypothetical protein